MKALVPFIIFSLLAGNKICCQCTEPGLKIESQSCDNPKNLIVRSVSCSEMRVGWTGGEHQSYLIKATCADLLTKSRSEAKVSGATCDKDGNCSAIIFVKDNSVTSWTAQSICVVDGAVFYSAEIKGTDASIPGCPTTDNILSNPDSLPANDIRVFPNPSTGYLIVDYAHKTNGNIQFSIFDGSGKQVFTKLDKATSTSRYTLDLKNLVNGIYLLKINNDKNANVVKFELMRK